MIPINIKLKTHLAETAEFMDTLGKLTQSFPGEGGELGLLYVLFVEKAAEEVVKRLEGVQNIEYAEIAPLRAIKT